MSSRPRWDARDLRVVEPLLLALVEVPRAGQHDGGLGDRPGSRHLGAHRPPGPAGQDRQAHAVEVAEDRRLRGVEVAVGVEPHDAGRRLAQPRDHAHGGEAAPGQHDGERALADGRGDARRHLADQVEARVDLAAVGPGELEQLRADPPAVSSQRTVRAAFEQPLGPAPHPFAQPAELVGHEDQAQFAHRRSVGAGRRRRHGPGGARLWPVGRVAQWESARFTRERSQVRNPPRPSSWNRATARFLRFRRGSRLLAGQADGKDLERNALRGVAVHRLVDLGRQGLPCLLD